MHKSEKIILAGLLLACIFALGIFLSSNYKFDDNEERFNDIEKYQVENMLLRGGYRFASQIDIQEIDGTFVGALSNELNELLPKLLQVYNSDPSNSFAVDEAFLRECLTSSLGTVTANRKDDVYKPFVYFLDWCGNPAELVNKETGETWSNNLEIENYRIILGRDEFSQFEYKYEYENNH